MTDKKPTVNLVLILNWFSIEWIPYVGYDEKDVQTCATVGKIKPYSPLPAGEGTTKPTAVGCYGTQLAATLPSQVLFCVCLHAHCVLSIFFAVNRTTKSAKQFTKDARQVCPQLLRDQVEREAQNPKNGGKDCFLTDNFPFGRYVPIGTVSPLMPCYIQ